jgi:serine/threonine protein phosphatase PrpC
MIMPPAPPSSPDDRRGGSAPPGVLESVRFFAATDIGRVRTHNEDNFLVDSRLGLFVVADGMGGHAAGEIASALAVRQLHDILCESEGTLSRFVKGEVSAKDILSLLSTAVQRASSRIHEQALADGTKRGMGTTLSALLFLGDRGFVAHVGDSRIYLLRNGRISQITDDHTVINELVKRGKLSREQIDRVAQKNAITRAVGVYERVEVDTLLVETAPGDSFLLCSDGLHGYFGVEEEMIPYLEPSMGEQCAAAIVAVANERGGKDNITAVIVRLEENAGSEGLARAKKLETKQRILAKMPLFTRLSKRELLRVMQIADVVSFRDGEYILREGQVGDELFVVLGGQVKVSAKDMYVTTLGAGDHLGELALLRNNPRNMTATSDGPSELVRFRRHDFFEILRTEPELSVKLLWQFLGVIADRLDQTTSDLGKAREQLESEDLTEEVFLRS